MRLFAIIFLSLLAHSASAGAWLRGEGDGFLSVSALHDEAGNIDGAIYAEYGLRPRLTLGLKIDAAMTNGRLGSGTAFVFARRPIGPQDRPYKLAYELGIGQTFGHNEDTLARTSLSYGRGFQLGKRSGWLAIDGIAEWSFGDNPDVFKLDSTVGLALGEKFKGMVQIFYSQAGEDQTATLAPSLIWQPKANWPSYQFGFEVEDGGDVSLRLGVWAEF